MTSSSFSFQKCLICKNNKIFLINVEILKILSCARNEKCLNPVNLVNPVCFLRRQKQEVRSKNDLNPVNLVNPVCFLRRQKPEARSKNNFNPVNLVNPVCFLKK